MHVWKHKTNAIALTWLTIDRIPWAVNSIILIILIYLPENAFKFKKLFYYLIDLQGQEREY